MPFTCVYAEMAGLICDGRVKLVITTTCGNNRSQHFSGMFGCTPSQVDLNIPLIVCIALLVGLFWCIPAVMICTRNLWFVKCLTSCCDTSLSSRTNCALSPLFFVS